MSYQGLKEVQENTDKVNEFYFSMQVKSSITHLEVNKDIQNVEHMVKRITDTQHKKQCVYSFLKLKHASGQQFLKYYHYSDYFKAYELQGPDIGISTLDTGQKASVSITGKNA